MVGGDCESGAAASDEAANIDSNIYERRIVPVAEVFIIQIYLIDQPGQGREQFDSLILISD